MAELDARLEAEKLRKLYSEDPKQESFKALITGETGTGKTYLIRTARKPIHIDSFDPGGTKGLIDFIKKGDVIPDISYESDDIEHPFAFAKWTKDFTERVRNKYFDSIGTYVLDSVTMWSEAVMAWVTNKDHRTGQMPKWEKDFNPQKFEMQQWLKRVLSLPCDVIVTGHLEPKTDEDGNVSRWRFLSTGKASLFIPLLFDEMYVMTARERANGIEYRIVTQNTGLYAAKTRMGRERFKVYEEADIKKLLEKAGRDSSDKAPLYERGGENDSTGVPRERRKQVVRH